MVHIRVTELRKRLAHFMDRVTDDRVPVLVTGQGVGSVVLLAKSEYDGMIEALNLCHNSAANDSCSGPA